MAKKAAAKKPLGKRVTHTNTAEFVEPGKVKEVCRLLKVDLEFVNELNLERRPATCFDSKTGIGLNEKWVLKVKTDFEEEL
jgi:hypothetical protein